MTYVFPAPAVPSLDVLGSDARFPVHRIYCIGQNYALHAKEMGAAVDRERPVFFCKPADAVVTGGADVPYPPATQELHHEVEMVVALGAGGRDVPPERALGLVFGYGVGLDLTRRDLQRQARENGRPWDTAKGFDHSAPVSALRPASEAGHPSRGRLRLAVDGQTRQQADLGEMIHGVAAIIGHLSRLFELKPGDLIFTGTPSGVGPLRPGDRFEAELEGIAALSGRIV